MSVTTELRFINVRCPEHRERFSVPATETILCDTTNHTLAEKFPHGDFWEYCCNCQTFYPSELNKSNEIGNVCAGCRRDVKKRYLCHKCNTISLQSEAQPRSGLPFLNGKGFIEPACPACLTVNQNLTVNEHSCQKNNAVFQTARDTCPFCSEPVVSAPVTPEVKSKPRPPLLPKVVETKSTQPEPEPFKITATQQMKYCPKCGLPNEISMTGCSRCAFDFTAKPVAEPPPIPLPTMTSNPTAETSSQSHSNKGAKIFAFVVLAIIGFFIVAIAITGIINKPSSAGNNTTANTNTARSVIGKTCRLTTNVKFRESFGTAYKPVAVHFTDAKVRILDIHRETGSPDWYKVEMTEEGCDMQFYPNWCHKNNPDDSDIGWINSNYCAF